MDYNKFDKANYINIIENDETLRQISEGSETVIASSVPIIPLETVDMDTGEILALTEFINPDSNNNFLAPIAEYEDIDVVQISNSSKRAATSLVNKITKFILEFNDVELNEEHKQYIKEVGQLELNSLVDLISLTEYNKKIIDNIVHRINSVQGEDYSMIQAYANLVNQHLKLTKELHTKHKSIPAVIKRMKAEVLCNQELGNNIDDVKLREEINQSVEVSSTKDFLRSLISQREDNES